MQNNNYNIEEGTKEEGIKGAWAMSMKHKEE